MNLTKRQEYLRNKYSSYSEKEIEIEKLVAQSVQIEKLERIRSNTSVMVWFFIGIPIFVFILVVFTGILGAL